jgi:ABC-type glutathione transport system ATPase component
MAERTTRRIQRHRDQSGLPAGKTFATFDFDAAPGIRKAHMLSLASGDGWIDSGGNLLIFGQSGTGKTHTIAAIVGMGATILNGAVIGDESIVGAGALVTENKVFPPRSLIVGSPARAISTLNEDRIEAMTKAASGYAEKANRYSAELKNMRIT